MLGCDGGCGVVLSINTTGVGTFALLDSDDYGQCEGL